MIIIRPIKATDYNGLHCMAIDSGYGFTSLPVNEAILKQRIQHSEKSFSLQLSEPSNQSYLFVMEDTQTGQIIGTSGIEAAVGLDNAFYHYHLGTVVHSSRELNIHNTVKTLALCNDYTGATEVCTLFLQENHRKNGNGRFLSRCRFLFMAEHTERFANCVIAEMRGISDKQGRSPFYEWLEKHFLSIQFTKADYLTGIGNKSFIAELMPKYPIYVSLLSKQAQKVINKVHKNTIPALRLLEAEGFSRRGYIDIFDAGPTVEAELKHIKTIRESKKYQILIDDKKSDKSKKKYIICNTNIESFRATQTQLILQKSEDIVVITSNIAQALQVQSGDSVRLISN